MRWAQHRPPVTDYDDSVRVVCANGIVHCNLKDVAWRARHLVHRVKRGDSALAHEVGGNQAPELCGLCTLDVTLGTWLPKISSAPAPIQSTDSLTRSPRIPGYLARAGLPRRGNPG